MARAYIIAFDAMVSSCTGPVAEFIKLRLAADKARVDSEAAQLELKKHKRSHARANGGLTNGQSGPDEFELAKWTEPPPGFKSKCSKCARLFVEHERLTSEYAAAVEALAARRDTSNVREYLRLRNIVDKARRDSQVAKSEFELHRRSHKQIN